MPQLLDPVQNRAKEGSTLQGSPEYIRNNIDLRSIEIYLTSLPSLAANSSFVGVVMETAYNVPQPVQVLWFRTLGSVYSVQLHVGRWSSV